MAKQPEIHVSIQPVGIECFMGFRSGECGFCGAKSSQLLSRSVKAKLTTRGGESFAWFMLGDICDACAERVKTEVL